MAARQERWINVALVIFSVVLSLIPIELAFRFSMGMPVFKWDDWRMNRLAFTRLGEHAEFDPYLGWALKPNFSSESHNTLDHGIRRNARETEVRTGHVLAVGDSFTEGWEVDDDDSWPAYLELMSKQPVVNAGVGGYGTDQILLRTEQLLPIIRPHTVIIGFLHFDLYRTGHTSFGAPKPWFSVEKGELVYHPPAPVERAPPSWGMRALMAMRSPLGYSAVADFLLGRLATGFWYGNGKAEYVKASQVDPVKVTCLLLDRVKKQIDAQKIRAILFMQYYAPLILENDQPPQDAQETMACAEKLGFEVVDHFPTLKAMTRENPDILHAYYLEDDGIYRHMSGEGNEHAAKLLLETLQKKPMPATR
jgi:hypothetical protein